MRLLVLLTAGLAYGLTFLSQLPLLLRLFELIPSSWNKALLFVLWPVALAAAIWVGVFTRRGARSGRAEHSWRPVETESGADPAGQGAV